MRDLGARSFATKPYSISTRAAAMAELTQKRVIAITCHCRTQDIVYSLVGESEARVASRKNALSTRRNGSQRSCGFILRSSMSSGSSCPDHTGY
jgi:hypothetical protein